MKIDLPRPAQSRGRKPLIVLGVIVGFLVIFGGAIATLYTDVLWFRETGYSSVLWKGISTRLGLAFSFGALFAVILGANIWIARKIEKPGRLFMVPDPVLERYRASLQPYMKWAVLGLVAVTAIFAGSGAGVQWRNLLMFQNGVEVGSVDPLFDRDLGFFLFRLPFLSFVYTWAFSSLVVITLITAGVHYVLGGIRPQAASGGRVAPEVRAHLSVLLAMVVGLRAWGYRLDQYNLVYSRRGAVAGATYTDVNAQLPALRLLVIIAIVCAVLFLINARVRSWALPVGGVGLLLLTAIIAGTFYPQAIQRLRVSPNERQQERPFIERHIAATREAFGLTKTTTRSFPARTDLTAKGLAANQDTVDNIRLWSPEVLGAQFLTTQRIKQYYEFLDVDVDRYKIGGRVRQVMLSARELDLKGLDGGARTWLNEHLVYTHGYGIVASRVNQVSAEGQPEFVLNNVPPESADPAFELTQPQIYFGEAEELPFIVVGAEQKELDYPQAADRFAETTYDGKGGIGLSSLTRRAAFAWRFGDVNLLISGAISSDSKILVRRHIRERIEQVAPFVTLDSDPYIAIVDGRATWIVDGYTTSNMYPYVERIDLGAVSNIVGRANYIRNSVKFTVDAKDGTITGFVWDEEDPIIRSWMKVYPGALRPKSEMPPGLLAHVRYPEDLFKIQTDRFGSYHITDPDNFYSKEDAWAIAGDPSGGATDVNAQSVAVEPYYQLMRLPGEKDLDFVLVRPFTPNRRQNLTAYMVAHGDPDEYGKLVLYTMPKNENIEGPDQVQSRINADPEVSPFVTLQSQQGSKVLFGNLLVLPIERSLLYVQPLYVRGSGSNLPELKKVVAVLGQDVRMGNSLGDVLNKLFGGGGSDGGGDDEPTTPTVTLAQLLARAVAADERAQQALRDGDFAEYGRQQRIMRNALRDAATRSGATPSPSPSPSPAPS